MPDNLQQPWHCFQDKPASLLGLATSAEDARVMLEALEAGTSGVVLKTEDPLQVYPHVPHGPFAHQVTPSHCLLCLYAYAEANLSKIPMESVNKALVLFSLKQHVHLACCRLMLHMGSSILQ